jgi:HAD superfamily hydrolase (TIGR01509 family)
MTMGGRLREKTPTFFLNAEKMYQESIKQYLKAKGYDGIRLKAVLFDMDGVLFDSMPNHAMAWHKTMAKFGFTLSYEEAYMHEGRTGASTINIVSQRERGHDATPEEIEAIYQAKTEEFNRCPKAERMPGAYEVLCKIKQEGLTPMVVTGSGQASLLDRLNHNFPDIFRRELMVTAHDVKFGKPNPEPYLMALEKAGIAANEAIVVENAPLGVRAGVAAGIFTVAVNTGPLPEEALLSEGANLLFPSMPDFDAHWQDLRTALDHTL